MTLNHRAFLVHCFSLESVLMHAMHMLITITLFTLHSKITLFSIDIGHLRLIDKTVDKNLCHLSQHYDTINLLT